MLMNTEKVPATRPPRRHSPGSEHSNPTSDTKCRRMAGLDNKNHVWSHLHTLFRAQLPVSSFLSIFLRQDPSPSSGQRYNRPFRHNINMRDSAKRMNAVCPTPLSPEQGRDCSQISD
ncbi:hypothetical protein OUZ56_017591 [Daphnia magna]|uniref:Uncharacterized protein n=1 Tax=Daphnia magna TaxID=35525 RepID=A0ABR0ATB3_9CRUS|nr:hypothetical protein OUZ56_017591 [Daphnia magna]